MFSLSETPLEPQALIQQIADPHAGAGVTFEGWVRNHNEGQEVRRLEYEAYATVALTEGNKILEEAKKKFGVDHAVCVHRTGSLEITDMAVWVGVSAAHRGEAFAACRYIIDEIKHRTPIWKKEHYVNGDSGWVECEHCAAGHHHHHHTPACTEADYYDRQVRLKDVGEAGQETLRNARVLVVGAGGLGAAALQYLTAAGIGTLGICENDVVDASNLHRQTLYGTDLLGNPKGEEAANRLKALNPFIHIQHYAQRLDKSNVTELVQHYDVLVDCTDNFETKFLLSDIAVLEKKLLIQSSIYQYEGQLFVYDPEADSPCMRCIWPEMPASHCVGNCAEVGVLGAVPGVFGALQAMECLKQLLNLPGKLQGETLFFDLLHYTARKVRAHKQPDCHDGEANRVKPIQEEPPLEWTCNGAGSPTENGLVVVDIREQEECEAAPLAIEDHIHLPMSTFDFDAVPLKKDTAYLLCCARGMRSKSMAVRLRDLGYTQVYSLAGGAPSLETLQSV